MDVKLCSTYLPTWISGRLTVNLSIKFMFTITEKTIEGRINYD